MDATTHPFVIVDMITRTVVGRAKTRAGANRSADRRDREYGAYRFHVMTTTAAKADGLV